MNEGRCLVIVCGLNIAKIDLLTNWAESYREPRDLFVRDTKWTLVVLYPFCGVHKNHTYLKETLALFGASLEEVMKGLTAVSCE